MASDDARLSALKATKLAALISHAAASATSTGSDAEVATGSETLSARPLADSSIVVAISGGRIHALVDSVNALGAILRWGRTHGRLGVTVFADDRDVAGNLARRAGLLTADVRVMAVHGAGAAEVEPLPVVDPPPLADSLWRAAAVMADAGARVVDDHGRLSGEVQGLEVARVEVAADDGRPRLLVGVGEADRELQHYVHGHLDDVERLRRAVRVVTEHRRPGSALHPLTRLSRPRWIRSALLAEPGLVGLAELEPRPPLEPKAGVYDREPAAAYSPSDRVTVVTSAGVDLDLLPAAADLRNRIDPDSSLLVVVPARDATLVVAGMADLVDRCEVTPVEPPWESLAS